jgi:hypothetical protein
MMKIAEDRAPILNRHEARTGHAFVAFRDECCDNRIVVDRVLRAVLVTGQISMLRLTTSHWSVPRNSRNSGQDGRLCIHYDSFSIV